MRSLRRGFWWVAPVLASIAGCQILAGVDDLKAHGTSHGDGGSSSNGTGVGTGVGGSGATGAGGGGQGGHCSPPDGQPACDFLTPFGKATINLTAEVAAADNDGSTYFGGLATRGQGPFGVCANPDGPCPFVQRLDAEGRPAEATTVTSTGIIYLSDLAVLPGKGVLFSGKMSNTGSLTLPGTATFGGTNNPGFIAGLTPDLSGALWAAQLHIDEPIDSQAQAHVGVADDGTVIGAGNVLTSGLVQWGGCQVTELPSPPGTEDVVMARFDSTGDCKALTSFGGPASQTADMLRVSGGGRILLGGTFGGQILFPGGSAETSVASSSVYYALLDRKLDVAWHGSIGNDKAVLIEGGSIAKHEKRAAIAGAFVGAVPEQLATGHCNPTTADGQGFVVTFAKIDTGVPARELVVCLGESSETTLYDAVVDDDGAVVIFGSTGGEVKYQGFHLTAQPKQSAAFVLKVDHAGNLVWATSAKAMPRGGFLRAGKGTGGFLGLGSFSAPVDFGCGCKATPMSANDVFLLQLGP